MGEINPSAVPLHAMPRSTPTPTPRDRLIRTATELFSRRGVSSVGINEVIRQSEVARMSLYHHFPSKDALTLAAYRELSAHRQDAISASLAAARSPRDAVLSVFDLAADLAGQPGFRGCAFLHLAAHASDPESEWHALVRSHKAWLRSQFAALAKRHGHPMPAVAARQLLALWDGALAEAYIEGGTAPISAARVAAAKLLGDRS